MYNNKQDLYNGLVQKRKDYDFKDIDLINPSKFENGIFDCDHLNAWAQWHGNLDAKFLLIGQDFSDGDYFKRYKGKDDPDSATNKTLRTLFNEIGVDIGTFGKPITEEKLYFTNAILGLKKGGMAAKIKKEWYLSTANEFIKPLINIIQPKVIVAMSKAAYETTALIYGLPVKKLKDVAGKKMELPDGKILFPVFHCSPGSLNRNRNLGDQKNDWSGLLPL